MDAGGIVSRDIARRSCTMSRWNFESTRPSSDSAVAITIQQNGGPVSRGEILRLWREDPELRRAFSVVLLEAGGEAFFWETPPWTAGTLGEAFECVVVPGSALSKRPANPKPFAGHFAAHPDDSVLCFPNLKGDAYLIVPTPMATTDAYPHLARFLQTAPPSQVDLFWQMAGEEMTQRISDLPLWLSTAGLGVSWLHLRIDTRPKYYRHRAYHTE